MGTSIDEKLGAIGYSLVKISHNKDEWDALQSRNHMPLNDAVAFVNNVFQGRIFLGFFPKAMVVIEHEKEIDEYYIGDRYDVYVKR